MVAVVGVVVAQVLVEVVYDEVFVVVVVVAVAVLVVAQVLIEVVYAEVLVVVLDIEAVCSVWCAKDGKVNQVPHELLAARCQF